MNASPGTVGILGVGAFGAALVDALVGKLPPGGLLLSSRGARSAAAAARHGIERLDNQSLVERCDVVLLCVRAEQASSCVEALRWRPGQLVVSTCASLPCRLLAPGCSPARLVRALPVPPALGVRGHTLLWPDDACARELLSCLGEVLVLPDEHRFAAGCAVACIHAWSHALVGWTVGWAEARGLDSGAAHRIAALGLQLAGARMREAVDTPIRDLLRDIATPGGLSEAGLGELGTHSVATAWYAALDAAADRAQPDDQ